MLFVLLFSLSFPSISFGKTSSVSFSKYGFNCTANGMVGVASGQPYGATSISGSPSFSAGSVYIQVNLWRDEKFLSSAHNTNSSKVSYVYTRATHSAVSGFQYHTSHYGTLNGGNQGSYAFYPPSVYYDYLSSVGSNSNPLVPYKQHSIDSYPKNSSGQTYGPLWSFDTSSVGPDLVLTVGENGKIGYVYLADIAPSPNDPLNQSSSEELTAREISVFANDGKTRIDYVLIQCGGFQQ